MNKHFLLLILILACKTLVAQSGPQAITGVSIPILDTHVHLWDLERPEGIYWIAKDNKALYRTMLPMTHEPIARKNNVRGVVVVQAGQFLPDNQWNLDVTAHNTELYLGVVGNLSETIGTEKFAPLFQELCKDPRYVGYRLSGRYAEEMSDTFFADLEMTARAGKTVDVLVGKYSLSDVAEIAARIPDLKIILDHFGGVRVSDKPLQEDWVRQFKSVAKHPNVYCKVSALFGRFEQQPAPQTIDVYRPVLDLAFASFGEDRLVYGSDWPVTRMTADYAAVVELTRKYFDAKGAAVCEKLFFKNAMRFYGIEFSQ